MSAFANGMSLISVLVDTASVNVFLSDAHHVADELAAVPNAGVRKVQPGRR